MTKTTRVVTGLVLLAFTDLTAYVLWQFGYLGFWKVALANAATILPVVDLVIALSLVTVWMWRDAARRGIGLAPYLALTALFGSVGPLLYLVVHGREAKLA